MKINTLLLLVGIVFCSFGGNAQTTWTGAKVVFSKADHADHTQAANQDMLTSGVILTRASTKGIFNIATESSYTKNSSPSGTEWAFGTTSSLPLPSAFQNWQDAINDKPLDALNKDMVLHLIADDIYLDIKFTQWTDGMSGSGGGFSYERATPMPSSVLNIKSDNISVYPNPANSVLNINGHNTGQSVSIKDLNGKLVLNTTIRNNSIDIKSLSDGAYFLFLENKTILRFVKSVD